MGYQEPRPVCSSLTTTHYETVTWGKPEGMGPASGVGAGWRGARGCLLLRLQDLIKAVLLCFISTGDAKCCTGSRYSPGRARARVAQAQPVPGPLTFEGCAFLPFSLGPTGDCSWY